MCGPFCCGPGQVPCTCPTTMNQLASDYRASQVNEGQILRAPGCPSGTQLWNTDNKNGIHKSNFRVCATGLDDAISQVSHIPDSAIFTNSECQQYGSDTYCNFEVDWPGKPASTVISGQTVNILSR